jgi:hypothetical protein
MLDQEALEKNGEELRKQEGWESIKVMPDGKNPNESVTKVSNLLNILEAGNAKSILQDYIAQLTKLDDQLRKEYQVVSADIKKVVVELGKQEDFSKVSKIISGLFDAQSDLNFYANKLKTLLLELEGED